MLNRRPNRSSDGFLRFWVLSESKHATISSGNSFSKVKVIAWLLLASRCFVPRGLGQRKGRILQSARAALFVWCFCSTPCVQWQRALLDACNKGVDTLPEMTRLTKRTPSKGRARHARRRLKQLLRTIPDLPADVLEHCSLRQLSFAVRKCRGCGTQSVLRGVAEICATDSTLPLLALPSLEGSSSASPFRE